MTAKATKAKKSAKPHSAKPAKTNKPAHVPTPWLKLKQLWEAGASYEAMAKATDAHYDPTKPDPTKPTRAKIWKARNVGVTIDGKLVKFGARGKVKEPANKGKPGKGVRKASEKGKAGKKAPQASTKPAKPVAQGEPKAEPPNSGPESTETSG